MPATIEGKVKALEALAKRREANVNENWANYTSSLPAGSPMYFGCITCNAAIVVPESYLHRPKLCFECQSLKDLGWLE
jgi:hypothetical protein